MLRVALLLLLGLNQVLSLSCPPCALQGPCQDPVCCDSGFLTKDVCGCCTVCAKPKNSNCGGPFGTGGTCAKGLSCFKACASGGGCATEQLPGGQSKQCIFPFVYKGKTYTECTTVESANKKAWCATKVNPDTNVVIRNQWGDCNEYCSAEAPPAPPGAPQAPPFRESCNLFNEQGRCLDTKRAQENLDIFRRTVGDDEAIVDEPSSGSNDQEIMLPCNDPFRTKPKTHCRCDNGEIRRDLSGNIKGGCSGQGNPGTFNVDDPDTQYGYCFLDNIQDPSNPSRNCFSDVSYSPADGRFYSFQACRDEFESGRIQN